MIEMPREERDKNWLEIQPDTFDTASVEVIRLQRTIALLIAGEFVSEKKAHQAYELLGG